MAIGSAKQRIGSGNSGCVTPEELFAHFSVLQARGLIDLTDAALLEPDACADLPGVQAAGLRF